MTDPAQWGRVSENVYLQNYVLIDRGIEKAVKIPRKLALLKVKIKKLKIYQYLQLSLTLDCLQFSQ